MAEKEQNKKKVGRPCNAHKKQFVGLRLDERIVLWLKSKPFYSRFVNDVLGRELDNENNNVR